MTTPTVPLINQSFLYVDDMVLEWVDQNSAKLKAGMARDSTNTNDIVLSQELVIDLRKSGLLGIDKGVLQATKQYAVYVVGDSTGYKQTSALVSLDLTKPVMPFGYDMFRRVGFMCTGTGSHLLKFFQYGNDTKKTYYYDVGDSADTIVMSGQSATTFTDVTLDLCVPAIETEVIFRLEYGQSNVTHTADFSPFMPTTRRLANGIISVSFAQLAIQYSQVIIPCKLNTLGEPTILYKVGAGDAATLIVIGFRDFL